MSRKIKIIGLAVWMSLIAQACGVYSFTGASIPPEAESVEIQYFKNQTDMVEATLSQDFTNSLKEKFASQTNLDVVESQGDLVFEGYIKDYKTEPTAIQGNQTAALNRLTITVFVKFTNKVEPESNFETTFSQYREYSSNKSLSEVKESLISEINKDLVEDIFNQSVVDW
ncbi:MAG: hypothetical protein K9J27_02095 [Bacteroidales bacterium]|nr:hypothetical protein [Bacteroidales bacterium]MCF8332720.1 hypothetical protein [Bacteroidales bacterium]